MSLKADPAWLYRAPVDEIERAYRDADAELHRKAGPELARNAMRVVMRAYRATDFVDADAFVRMAVSALEDLPECAVRALADPKQGIVRTAKFPPVIAELVAWCEAYLSPVWGVIGACRTRTQELRDAERSKARQQDDDERARFIEAERREKADIAARIAANPERYVTAYEARK